MSPGLPVAPPYSHAIPAADRLISHEPARGVDPREAARSQELGGGASGMPTDRTPTLPRSALPVTFPLESPTAGPGLPSRNNAKCERMSPSTSLLLASQGKAYPSGWQSTGKLHRESI